MEKDFPVILMNSLLSSSISVTCFPNLILHLTPLLIWFTHPTPQVSINIMPGEFSLVMISMHVLEILHVALWSICFRGSYLSSCFRYFQLGKICFRWKIGCLSASCSFVKELNLGNVQRRNMKRKAVQKLVLLFLSIIACHALYTQRTA